MQSAEHKNEIGYHTQININFFGEGTQMAEYKVR